MKNFMLKTVSVAGLTAAMSLPAAAMTCKEFNALDAEGQLAAMYDMGGREAARMKARGNDEAMEAEGHGDVSVENNDNTEGGKEGRDEMARGADVVVTIMEGCGESENHDTDIRLMVDEMRG